MTIEIFKNQKGLTCKIPEQGEKALLELYVAVGMLSDEQLKSTLGAEMPEIVCNCELSGKEQAMINQIKSALEGKYK